jgi:hypothetical protein
VLAQNAEPFGPSDAEPGGEIAKSGLHTRRLSSASYLSRRRLRRLRLLPHRSRCSRSASSRSQAPLHRRRALLRLHFRPREDRKGSLWKHPTELLQAFHRHPEQLLCCPGAGAVSISGDEDIFLTGELVRSDSKMGDTAPAGLGSALFVGTSWHPSSSSSDWVSWPSPTA